jgi:ankyrin repeat protein
LKYLTQEYNANKDTQDQIEYTELRNACYKGHLDTVKYLINECNANVNVQDNHGVTALQTSIQHNYLDIVQYLINHGNADITITTNYNLNVFDYVLRSEHRNDIVVEMVLTRYKHKT